MTTTSFYGLGIAPKLLDILDQLKFTTPTPIQQQSIPTAIQGKDIIGIAQTGTGKTLAFGIPVIQQLAQIKGQALIVAPTRELALQIDETLVRVGKSVGLRTVVLIGGASMKPQIQSLRRTPHVIVATPGRLLDHLEQKNVSFAQMKILVLDEADRMFDMGFAPQIKRILNALPKERQTMLFSATMPSDIVNLAKTYMKLPTRVEIAPEGSVADRVTQELFFVQKDDKGRLLEKLLNEYKGTILIFTRTKFGAKSVCKHIRHMNFTVAEIHSNKSLAQRRAALDGFKSGKFRVLVATDIAARGIDVTGIELVINYDLPDNPADYVHRIGRTGRAGESGHAISFATMDQRQEVKSIERITRTPLPTSQLPTLPPRRTQPQPESRSHGQHHDQAESFSDHKQFSYKRAAARATPSSSRPKRPFRKPRY